jgi:glc operon protein GlcG
VQVGSAIVAQEKAKAAFLFKRPTKVFEEIVLGGRANMAHLPGALAVEGGLPLIHDGELVGAIGISGVTSAQDGQVAQAGADVLSTL